MDVVTAQQIKTAQQFEQTERKNESLVQHLKQACSRNKALEKKELWDHRHRQDHGSKFSISLKSNQGEVHELPKIPTGAEVTQNSINKYEEQRRRNATCKEDSQLSRFCDGQDTAWRPDNFFTEVCGEEEVPPWPIRPTELFTNPHLTFRIMALQMEKRKARKLAKKLKKEMEEEEEEEEDKAPGKKVRQKEKKAKKEKEQKKDKKAKKAKKEKKGKKDKKDRRDAKKRSDKKEKNEKKEKKEKDRGKQKGGARLKGDDAAERKKERKLSGSGQERCGKEVGKEEGLDQLVLKPNEERRRRSRETEPQEAPQAKEGEESSSEEDSSEEEEDEKGNSVQEVGSNSEADWD